MSKCALRPRRWPALLRGATATAASAASALGCGLLTRQSLETVTSPPGARPDEAVVLVAAGLATVVFAWLALLLLLATLTALPGSLGGLGRRISRRLVPVWGGRLSAVVLGVVVASSAGAAAQATPAQTVAATSSGGFAAASGLTAGAGFTTVSRVTAAPRVVGDVSAAPDPGWTAPAPPRRQRGDHAALVTTPPRPGWHTDEPDEVVVRRGDSLWAIAARHLGPDATPTQVAAEWPRWYAANRHLIGDDPSQILPGQLLRAPSAHGDRASTSGPTPGAGADRATRAAS